MIMTGDVRLFLCLLKTLFVALHGKVYAVIVIIIIILDDDDDDLIDSIMSSC